MNYFKIIPSSIYFNILVIKIVLFRIFFEIIYMYKFRDFYKWFYKIKTKIKKLKGISI